MGPLLFSLVVTVGGRVCSPVAGIQAPKSIGELYCEVVRTGVVLPGEELLSVPLQELCIGKSTL